MVIDGKAIASQKLEDLKNKIEESKLKPKLAIVLVGDDPASRIYVNLKIKKAKELGIETEVRTDLNTDADGIIVQLPGPQELVDKIPLEKDVDGLREGSPFLPATVRAILAILDKVPGSSGQVLDKTVVIVGQGKLIGKPLADYLEKIGVEVIRCDVDTKDLKMETQKGDILVAAAGVPSLIKADMIKPGAIVIDCGSPVAEVDFETVSKIASAVTPVPGGVGPLTVASLLENVVEASIIGDDGK